MATAESKDECTMKQGQSNEIRAGFANSIFAHARIIRLWAKSLSSSALFWNEALNRTKGLTSLQFFCLCHLLYSIHLHKGA
jgi:hypothetical protein